jgi:nucleoside-diphosphate-sugar epimerase
VFVKRVLDRRPAVLLSARGEGIVHPTAAVNIAALIETVAHQPGARILNSADPDAPSAREIAKTIARQLGHFWDEVLLDESADPGLGRTPWDAPHPVVLDTTASLELGYKPVGGYAATVAEEVDWLFDVYRAGDPDGLLPAPDDPYFAGFFDYPAEDAYLGNG